LGVGANLSGSTPAVAVGEIRAEAFRQQFGRARAAEGGGVVRAVGEAAQVERRVIDRAAPVDDPVGKRLADPGA